MFQQMPSRMQSIKSYDYSCLIATFFFLFTNFIGFILYTIYRSRYTYDWDLFLEFDATYIQTQWAFRNDNSTLRLMYGIFNALTWFILIIPILKVIWILSHHGKHLLGVHISMTICLLGGSFCELVANLLEIGTFSASVWISSGSFNLNDWTPSDRDDDLGWKTLEMVYIVTSAMLLWIDSIEWLFLSFVFIMIYYSIYKTNKENNSAVDAFDIVWAKYGAALGCICLFDFISNLLRYQSWSFFNSIASLITTLNRLVLIPIWLLWLSVQLPKAEAILFGYSNTATTTTTSNNDVNNNSNGPAITMISSNNNPVDDTHNNNNNTANNIDNSAHDNWNTIALDEEEKVII